MTINDKWLKASVLGTTWAASEIVFGSFLHNLRIPFSGNFLTAIGLIILISAAYKWKESGIFWRAGIICGLMKTLSPSAVIFGPMVAILSEALLLELSVFILGRNVFGFLLGSVLAMTWVLAQRVLNYILFYGTDIVDIYANLMKMLEKNLHIETDLVWWPIVAFLIIHIVFGLVAGIIGIQAGRSLNSPSEIARFQNQNYKMKPKAKSDIFKYNLIWLWSNIVILIGSLFIIGNSPIWVWVLWVLAVIVVWTIRYQSALRQLSKPKFWIFFVSITMLAAFVFSSMQTGSNALMNGLITGVQMNFRAAIVIIGFSVLGKELYNPKVVLFFQKSSFKQLHLALELSFQSVPSVISGLPGVKVFLKQPVLVIRYLIDKAEKQLRLYQNNTPVFVITGHIGQGKTQFITNLIPLLADHQIPVSGFYCKRLMQNSETIGYDLVDLTNQNSFPFLTTTPNNLLDKIGKYSIIPEALEQAQSIIDNLPQTKHTRLVIIDEVGKLELKGQGWHSIINQIFDSKQPLLISVRRDFLNDVLHHWNIENAIIIDVESTHVQNAAEQIAQTIGSK